MVANLSCYASWSRLETGRIQIAKKEQFIVAGTHTHSSQEIMKEIIYNTNGQTRGMPP